MTTTGLRSLVALASLVLIALGLWGLESERQGLVITRFPVGSIPATFYRRAQGAKAPAVIVAHGFAGSQQLMQAYALTLAQAGYVAVTFDFDGHGRNPVPLSGDVTRTDGTTQILMREIGLVTDAALDLPEVDGRLALLGHSMASDIIVRRAKEDPRVAATVAISMFSDAVTPTAPRNLLMISGVWEAYLREDALKNARLAKPGAVEGETIGDPAEDNSRRAVVAPHVEHVTVLYSQTALREARDWLDRVFHRTSNTPVANTGGWIVLLLSGIVLLAWPLSNLLPLQKVPPTDIPLRIYLAAVVLPALVTPLVLSVVDTHFLPVLVADYLTAHLLVYGLLSIGVMTWRSVRLGKVDWLSSVIVTLYCVVVFGVTLDRYVASFVPIGGRLPIIAAIAVGAVPYMLSDSLVTEGGRASLIRRFFARLAFLLSLGVAVALDFKRLFFLVIIIPVIVLFFIIFGLIGGWVGRRTQSPATVGIALGVTLAWAMGVTFPMFTS